MDEQRKPIEMPSAEVADYSNEINALYDAQKAQQEQSLKTAYDQNVQTLQNSKQAIAPLYNQQANDLSTQFERTRRMNNMKADFNGLNTGAASQMDLAQQSNYLDSFGKLRTAQAQAEQAVDQKLADLEINYKNSVAQALADNDYQRAAALMKEYQRRDEATKEEQRYQYQIQTAAQQYADQYARQQEQDAFAREQYDNSWNRQLEQDALANQRYNTEWEQKLAEYQNELAQYDTQWARQKEQDAFAREQYQNELAAQSWEQQYRERAYNDALAQQQADDALNSAKAKAAYGDFSGYAALYGQETADAMKAYWMFTNPNYGLSTGNLTPEQYLQALGMTGLGSTSSGGSSGGGGSRRSVAPAFDEAAIREWIANHPNATQKEMQDFINANIFMNNYDEATSSAFTNAAMNAYDQWGSFFGTTPAPSTTTPTITKGLITKPSGKTTPTNKIVPPTK